MKKYILSVFLNFLALTITSCNNDFKDDVSDSVVVSGSADFTRYVALGNSLTSGYRNGALYILAQQESYPAVLAGQMKKVGELDFKIPFMNDELGGIVNPGNPSQPIATSKLILGMVNGSLTPVPTSGGTTTLVNIYSQGPFQNMGIPGAKLLHLLASGYGNPAGLSVTPATANPYFVRIASSATTSVLEDAINQNPTFFSLWIGNNDVLGFATTGGDGTDLITDPVTFSGAYTKLVQQLTAKGAKGVVANIPKITDLPFFTTVPYNALTVQNLTAKDPEQINKLNGLFTPLNKVFESLGKPERKIVYSSTQNNPLLIKDKDLEDIGPAIEEAYNSQGADPQTAKIMGELYGQARQATSKDLPVLQSSSILGKFNETVALNLGLPPSLAYNGTTYPLEDQWVLTEAGAVKVLTATESYNNVIKGLADTYNLAFVDVYKLMGDLNRKSGIAYDGVSYTSKFVVGGSFSLDGIHPTGRGYAFIANEFIKAINNKYGATLPQVSPNSYNGVDFP